MIAVQAERMQQARASSIRQFDGVPIEGVAHTQRTPQNTLDLLHVDDDESDRFFLARAVTNSKLPILLQSVASGEEALLALDSRLTLPDLMLLDIHMPAMSGFELLEILKRRECLREIPVIMFSNSSQPNDVDRARDLDAHSYCLKPLSLEEFGALIRRLYESWLRSAIRCEWPMVSSAIPL